MGKERENLIRIAESLDLQRSFRVGQTADSEFGKRAVSALSRAK